MNKQPVTGSSHLLTKLKKHAASGTLFSMLAARALSRFTRRRRAEVPYQIEKGNAAEKWSLVEPELKALGVRSFLDIGCNAGAVTRLGGDAGFFAVGIDKRLDLRGVEDPLRSACLGNVPLTMELADHLPEFDALLLLSVHHQWVSMNGDDYARDLMARLSERARLALVVEFAALNSKYGCDDTTLFIDNDQDSISSYALGWLSSTLPDWQVKYIGRCPDRPDEPFRDAFMCRRPCAR
jgi:hypothetical protein